MTKENCETVSLTAGIVLVIGMIIGGICYNCYLETHIAKEALKNGYTQAPYGRWIKPGQ